jgi:hypothetical protein
MGRLFDPGCKPGLAVSSNGEPAGAMPAPSADAKALFVTAHKTKCYRFAWLGYGPGSPLPAPRYLRGAQVHPLPVERIDFFLKPAPARAGSPQTLTELIAAPCNESG